MSVSETSTLQITDATIESLSGKKTSLLPNILTIDYFENILEPSVMMEIQITSMSTIFNIIPIRGGEKFTLELETARGTWGFDDDNPLYVYKVSDLNTQQMGESFTLHLVSREFLTNETNRCVRKYEKKNIHEHVKSILKDVLKTDRYSDDSIEKSSNSYTFIGNYKKAFHTLEWLGPKAVSATDSSTKGTSGQGKNAIAKGTAGFLFYENKDGFNFKSIYGLTSSLNVSKGSSNKKINSTYSFSGIISESISQAQPLKIVKWFLEKNIDLRKSLRIGMYSNYTYFYDMITNKLTGYKYSLKDQIGNKTLGKDEIPVSDQFGESVSRVMFRMSDHGALEKGAGLETSGRDHADMAKSFSRYNLLFTQAINILVPLNNDLKVGDIITCEFPLKDGDAKEMDPEISGNYLIRELRHHFTANQNSTSLKLMRDSYGLHGPDN